MRSHVSAHRKTISTEDGTLSRHEVAEFDIQIVVDRLAAPFSAHAAVVDAAERRLRMGDRKRVNPDHATVNGGA